MIIIPWLPIHLVLLYSIFFAFKKGKIISVKKSFGSYMAGDEINFKRNPIRFIFQVLFEILLFLLITAGLIVIIKKHFFNINL